MERNKQIETLESGLTAIMYTKKDGSKRFDIATRKAELVPASKSQAELDRKFVEAQTVALIGNDEADRDIAIAKLKARFLEKEPTERKQSEATVTYWSFTANDWRAYSNSEDVQMWPLADIEAGVSLLQAPRPND